MDVETAERTAADNPEEVREYHDKIRVVLGRSATDRAFRQRLIEQPRETIKEATGGDIGALDVRFVENTADATIVLPEYVDPEAELQESELEAVAGGTDPCVGTIVVSILGIASAIKMIADMK